MKRTPRPASDLVRGWYSSLTAATAPTAPPSADADPTDPTDGTEGSPADEAIDAQVSEGLSKLQADLADLLATQTTDPGNAEPGSPDADVLKALQQASDALDAAAKAQAADAAEAPTPDDTKPTDPSAPADGDMAVPGGPDATKGPEPEPDDRPGQPPTEAVDPNVQCADPTCAHMASGHADDPVTGENTGPCQMEACVCSGMRVPDGDAIGSGPPRGGDAHSVDGQTFAAGPLPGDTLDPTTQTPGSNGSPSDPAANTGSDPTDGAGTVQDGGPSLAIPTGPMAGPAFTIPVVIIEGVQTSDGRMVQPEALTWRNPPMPLMGLRETTDYGHTGAVIVGRIDQMWRDGTTISASGHFDTSDDGLEFARLVEDGMIVGVSADIADTTSEVTVTAIGEDGFPTEVADTITAGEIMGATVCPFPAFAGAYIVLGDGTDGPAPIPQTPTPEQAAAGIHVLSTKACAPCEAGALVASSVPLAPPREWFEDPGLAEPTKLTVDSDGRVFGHLAAWGTCHIAAGGGRCVTPPRGAEYSFFRTGYVVTADGAEVPTGPITVNTGHASTDPRMSAAAAMAHYDNTGSAVADVAVGEDEHGIWLAGAIRPTASDEQVHMLRASAVSGDWRPIGRGMELVAALAVNRPGFPITKAVTHDGELTSLVAAGMVIDIEAPTAPTPTEADRLATLEAAFGAVAPFAAASVRERFDSLRG